MTLSARWIDGRREPRVAPNPAYPNGMDVDMSGGAEASCVVKVPCPAKRIGFYLIKCDVCGQNALVTTAGRPDDPRSIRLACKLAEGKKGN